ncbi:MAG TPA: MBL fold metallo-hydrolase [Verrucomicrobiae bacterium]
MKTVLVIEAEQVLRRGLTPGLNEDGWSVINAADHGHALAATREHQPELVVCDWQTPLYEIARSCCAPNEKPGRRPILVALGDGHLEDRLAALESGADEYAARSTPPRFLGRFLAGLSSNGSGGGAHKTGQPEGGHETYLKFWGVRGSIATPGSDTVSYGGNTSCVELRVGREIIILDAGTGIRKLGLALVEEFGDRPINLNLLITHTHWDHIQGFPFFTPAYNPHNAVTIYGDGARQGLENTLSSQMENPYFPITMQQMPGHIAFSELEETTFRVGSIEVKAHFMNHPGVCVGYRLSTPGGSVSYLPDVELFQQVRAKAKAGAASGQLGAFDAVPAEDLAALEFIRDSDILVLDCQYDPEEYEERIGWGHSCFEDSVTFAMQGNVKQLFMFHHDPDHTDEKVSRMVARAREMASRARSPITIQAAREGLVAPLPAKHIPV